MKSVEPQDGSGEPPTQGGGRDADADFHDPKRSNDTHTSTIDPNAGLHRKGKEADKLCFIGQGPDEEPHIVQTIQRTESLIMKHHRMVHSIFPT
jgi:hypothetical protein